MRNLIEVTIKSGEKEHTMEVEEGTMLKQLITEEESAGRPEIVMAKVDNAGTDLLYKIEEPCTVEFMDLSIPSTRLVYQRSLIFLFLKAAFDINEECSDIAVKYSLNSGIFLEYTDECDMTDEFIKDVDKRMRELIESDVSFRRRIRTREEILTSECVDREIEEQQNFVNVSDIDRVFAYYCEDFRAFFYGALVPSAGYIKLFDLVGYENGVILRSPQYGSPDSLPQLHDERKLFEAFREAEEWGDLLEIKTTNDLNRKIKKEEWREIIQVSEALHEKKIAQIADIITRQKKRIILIAGPSSSGKTSFAQRLCIQLRVNGVKPLYMGTDDYFVERHQTPLDEHGKFDFENINAVDLNLFNRNMNDLLEGKEVDLPVFDFITGSKRYGERITKADPDQPIVIEGIHALNKKLTSEINEEQKYKIYISPFAPLCVDKHNRIPITDTRLLRRIARDNRSRGKTASDTIALWPSVRNGENKNIFPYNNEADIFFNSILIYEMAVLKPVVQPLLLEITRDSDEYIEARRLLNLLKGINTIEDTSFILNNSIIREFIGGSVLVK